MGASLRKLVATIVLIVFVVIYCLIALEIGAHVAGRMGPAGQFVYFAIAGLIWVLPAGLIIKFGWGRRSG